VKSGGRLAEYGEWLAALAAETWVLLGEGDWRDPLISLWHAIKTVLHGGLFLIVFLLGLAGALRWVRGRRRLSGQVMPHYPRAETSEVEAQLQEFRETLERSWKKVGLGRPPSQGLLEHLEGILPEKVSSEFLELSRRLASAYYHLSFGVRKPSSDDFRELDRLSAQLASEAQRTLKAAIR
jgi:hypothetical protein